MAPELAKIDNIQLIKNYSGPLLILVAQDDSITPVKFSQKLYEATSSSEKTLAIILDSEHGKPMKKNQTIKAYQRFIKKITKPKAVNKITEVKINLSTPG